ncbi:hypothetical protein B0I33_11396 [Prauserella shujinwangii]|uniref:Uncharacterized protein n=1 Tax=Prauserella shujinwangii TaxID=1453103 RepID=A0A2T0LLT2_9PSEU|nr:hypothetical protein [Prauserella shujinwangii]PRX43930.1 hypothetical protein B0I33_11396 [Prauserella shujinwangii]
MTFEDHLPGLIVVSYALMALCLWGRSKLRAKLPPPSADEDAGESQVPTPAPGSIGPEAGAGATRTGARALAWGAAVLGTGTTVTWLYAALDLSGIVVLLAVLLGLVLFGLMLGLALQSESATSKLFGVLGAAVVLADFWFLMLAPLLHLLGLTRDIALHVTSVFESRNRLGAGQATTVQGSYELDGAEHQADVWWLALGGAPEEGETVAAGLSPAWPHQIIGETSEAWLLLGIGAGTAVLYGCVFFGVVSGTRRFRTRRNTPAEQGTGR